MIHPTVNTTSLTAPTAYKKKLIEVALPLEEINAASAREKSIRHGHPSTLHLWWARRPLAACRAVLFASLVDDPSSDPSLSQTEADTERERLFVILRKLVKWESSTDEAVLAEARAEIMRSTGGNPPPLLDPFCGGGSIPLEAQRLGLEVHGSDLNPVAVLITKALIEIPPKFAGRPPINRTDRGKIGSGGNWTGAQGLAADVRYYGKWMRDEAERRIGHLYPKAKLPGGGEATVIAWLWARTVTCPNPACGAQMPLVASPWLCTKPTKPAWAEPLVSPTTGSVEFEVRFGAGEPRIALKTGRGANFRCAVCEQAVDERHIKTEASARRMGAQLMAIAAQGKRTRVYLNPTKEQESTGLGVPSSWGSQVSLSRHPQYMAPPRYGLDTHESLFTRRQLLALNTFGDLLQDVRLSIIDDCELAGGNGNSLAGDVQLYADAVITYLAFALDKGANYWSSSCSWHQSLEKLVSTFGLPVMNMVWDFAEANPFSTSSGNWMGGVEQAAEVLEKLPARGKGTANQHDASSPGIGLQHDQWLVSTDPPYYDNVPYADLSDFFYTWLRKNLSSAYPELFSTLQVPKLEELVADQTRHGGKAAARDFFDSGLTKVFRNIHDANHGSFPFTVFYAFKQAENTGDQRAGSDLTSSTGWETMLEGLLRASFQVTATWPVRTEQSGGLRESGRNALASSIVIACRPRPVTAEVATRRDFVVALRSELPQALILLQRGNIAPVDLAQASIGPGMAVFSRYAKVLEADGTPLRVRTALQLINQELDAYLEQQEGELDRETRFCIAWFEQNARRPNAFGQADVLARAKDTSVAGLVTAGVAATEAGKLRLLRTDELKADWDPQTDRRVTVWECTHHLIRRLEADGETGAAELLGALSGDLGDRARALAYRLYSLCEKKKWAEEALAYNALVASWPAIQDKAANVRRDLTQGRLV